VSFADTEKERLEHKARSKPDTSDFMLNLLFINMNCYFQTSVARFCIQDIGWNPQGIPE
jgi:hypothetical protein